MYPILYEKYHNLIIELMNVCLYADIQLYRYTKYFLLKDLYEVT